MLLDPQQRIIAEVVAEALATSPWQQHLLPPPAPLPLNATGVYMGVASSDYGSLVASYGGRSGAFHATSNAISVVAGRLSFMFGMTGMCAIFLILYGTGREMRQAEG